MSAQFDFLAGLDISSLASVTQAQLMQMVNQIAPLGNIGGIVAQAGTSQADSIPQGTAGSPDVSGNPRFDRYVWINTFAKPYVLYTYNATSGNWTTSTTPNFSIGNLQHRRAQNDGVDITGNFDPTIGGIDYRLLKNNADGSPTSGDARKILRLDANGRFFVTSSINTILEGIDLGGGNVPNPSAPDQILRSNHVTQAIEWSAFDAPNMLSAGGIPVDKLAPGTNLFVLRTNNSGQVEWVRTNAVLQTGDVTLDKLGNNTSAGGAPQTGYVIGYNGTSRQWMPSVMTYQSPLTTITSVNRIILPTTAHNLGGIPHIVEGFIRTPNGDLGYPAGSILPVSQVYGGGPLPAFSIFYTSTNVGCVIPNIGTIQALNVTSTPFLFVTINLANWQFYVNLIRFNLSTLP